MTQAEGKRAAKVLLVNPPFMRLMGVKSTYMPLGLGYLARHLIDNGIPCSIYNAELTEGPGRADESPSFAERLVRHESYKKALRDGDHAVWSEFRNLLTTSDPDIIGVSVMSAKLESALKIAAISKDMNPGRRVIFGGFHPTVAPDEILNHAAVDFVIRGEGEHTLLESCRALIGERSELSGINGLSFRRNGDVVHNPPRPLESNLGAFHYPTREEYLHLELYPKLSLGAMMSSRGCPYDCTFCNAKSIWSRKVRYREVDEVISEMAWLKEKYGVPRYTFNDDSFTVNRSRTEKLLEKIVASKLGVPWVCQTRTDLLDENLLKKMIAAGCVSLAIGLESVSDRMLKIIKKNLTMASFKKALAFIERSNIDYGVYLMVGFPEETEEEILKSIDFVRASRAPFIGLSVFTPYPGCESYQRAKEMGVIKGELDWSSYSHQSIENYFSFNIPKERFTELVRRLAKEVDKHNRKMAAPFERYRRKIRYYGGNPRLLARKVLRSVH